MQDMLCYTFQTLLRAPCLYAALALFAWAWASVQRAVFFILSHNKLLMKILAALGIVW